MFLVVGIIAVAAVFGWQSIDSPQPNRDEDNSDHITMVVLFEPTPRSNGVRIIATVAGARVFDAPVTQAPWRHQLNVPRGTHLSLTAEQSTDGRLECQILDDGGKISQSRRSDSGTVKCYHNRP